MCRLGCLALVIVIAIAGYWAYENFYKGGRGEALVTACADAKAHIDKARDLIERHKLLEAQTELAAALKSLDEAEGVSESLSEQAAKMWGTTKEQAEKALKKAETYVLEGSKPKGVK